MSGIAQRWAHNGDWHGPSWHGLSPWLLMSGSPENWGIGVWRPYLAASECTSWGAGGWRKDCLCGFPVTDPESGSTELETETASSVEGRSLNPRVQKEQKEDFGGRLFLRVLWSSKHFISSSCRILQNPILWIYHSVFIFCFWSFDCFQFLSFTNRATINIKKKKTVWCTYDKFLLDVNINEISGQRLA